MVSQRGMQIRYLKSLDQNFPIKGLKYLIQHFQRQLLESSNRPVYRILNFDFMPIVNNLIILSNYFMALTIWASICHREKSPARWTDQTIDGWRKYVNMTDNKITYI